MRTLLLFLALFLVQYTSYSQNGWVLQKSGTTGFIESISCVDNQNCWAMGINDTFNTVVLHTTNGGDTWETQFNEFVYPSQHDLYDPGTLIDFYDLNNGFFGGNWYSYLTTDGGKNWIKIHINYADYTSDDCWDIKYVNNHTIWAISNMGSVIKSTDNGDTWEESLNESIAWNSLYFLDSLNGWVTPGGGLYITSDGGKNWVEKRYNYFVWGYDMAFTDINTGWMTGAVGQMYNTTDGGNSWNEFELDPSEHFIKQVLFTDKYHGWALANGGLNTQNSVLYKTTNGGQHWYRDTTFPDEYIIYIEFTDSLNGWAVGMNGNIWHTTNEPPVQIKNVQELQQIVSNNNKANYILMNDIDASETRLWNVGDHDGNPNTPEEPMGFKPIENFTGYFNGNGHIISNLFINRPAEDSVAFIKRLDCVINKFGLENCDITGKNQVSSMICIFLGNSVNECFTTGKVFIADTNGYCRGAGFCAIPNQGSITNCYSSCVVKSNSKEYDNNLASFCNNRTIPFYTAIHCYSIGKIDGTGEISAFGRDEIAIRSFWDVETTGIPDTITDSSDYRAKGLPTSEMMKKSTFEKVCWDFENIWCIDEGKDYPKLRAFGKCPPTDLPQEPNRIEEILNISPNPSTTTCTISFGESGLCRKFQLFNCFGEDVTGAILNPKINDNNIQFDVSALSGSVYFAVLELNGRHYSKPFIVVK
ncbi:MAG: hypothetical protein EPN82_15525 [Bacteroidetes bacterium]|nr:MAG: hypothetical protein EPN82_15525 [Bacteroidota bacterium]